MTEKELRFHLRTDVSREGHSIYAWNKDTRTTLEDMHNKDHRLFQQFLNHTHPERVTIVEGMPPV